MHDTTWLRFQLEALVGGPENCDWHSRTELAGNLVSELSAGLFCRRPILSR